MTGIRFPDHIIRLSRQAVSVPGGENDMNRYPGTSRISAGSRWLAVLVCALLLFHPAVQFGSRAESPDTDTVRVGYYENEVFQEGASPDAVKTGYSYEYYRKLSEYTGWKYEYVYGSYSDLYQMLLNGDIDLLAALPGGKSARA